MQSGAERRRFFRVEDRAILDYQVLTEAEMEQGISRMDRSEPADLDPAMALLRIEADLQRALAGIQRESREVAKCLDLLNNKVNILAGMVPAFAEEKSPLTREAARCNLSASGVAFSASEHLETDTCLRMRMVILPMYNSVIAYAKVVRSSPLQEPDGEFTHTIAVTFTAILDRYKEMLIRRSMQREAELLRSRRLERERSAL